MKNSHILSLSHRDRTALERRRQKAAKLFKKGVSQAEAARQFKVSREAVRHWYDAWKQKGLNGLESLGKPGPKAKLTDKKLKKVKAALLKGPTALGFATQIWTLKRIALMIRRVAKVKYGTTRVWQILGAINWTCQKPRTRPIERDEQTIRRWLKNTWPRLKKNHAELAQN